MEKVGAAGSLGVQGNVEIIESYKVRVDNLILTVNILGGKGITRTYFIIVPKIAPATKALMEHVKHSLVSEVAVSTAEILDPKAIQTLKEKLK